LAGWAAAAGSLSRLHQTVLGWHVVSTSNPTAAFSAFQTGYKIWQNTGFWQMTDPPRRKKDPPSDKRPMIWNLVMSAGRGSTPRQTVWLIVSCKVTWALGLITFVPEGRFLWNSSNGSCHGRGPRRHTLISRSFNHSKMADVQTSEVHAELTPINVGPWRVRTDNHGNHAILVWQLNPYLCNNGSHCLTTATMVCNVTIETNVCSLPLLNSATDTLLLNNVSKVYELVYPEHLLMSWCYCTINLQKNNDSAVSFC
jgi:hypothetical protein